MYIHVLRIECGEIWGHRFPIEAVDTNLAIAGVGKSSKIARSNIDN